jgi:hypothetical protein
MTHFQEYEPSKKDVHPLWWISYMVSAFQRSAEGKCSSIAKVLEMLEEVTTVEGYVGPELPGPVLGPPVDSEAISVKFQIPSVVDSVSNWTRWELLQILGSSFGLVNRFGYNGSVRPPSRF